MEERDYKEVYDNGSNLLEVFVHVGDIKVFPQLIARRANGKYSVPYRI